MSNFAQKVFEQVAAAGTPGATQPELEAALPFLQSESIRQALRRLAEDDPPRVGVIRRYTAGLRRSVYFVPPGTRPPADRRGRPRKEPA